MNNLEEWEEISNKEFEKNKEKYEYKKVDVDGNPDFIKMMEYSNSIGIIPNFTLSGIDLTDEIAEKCSKLVGAVAVSAYQSNKNTCYDAVKKFTDLGIEQTNIHVLVSEENFQFVLEVIEDRVNDDRLSKMNAIVFLGVKPKGRAVGGYHTLSKEKYAYLVNKCIDLQIRFGFDSCSCGKFEHAVDLMNIDDDKKKMFKQMGESCESSLFSAYINVKGEYWHCSFSENNDNVGFINVLEAEDFIKDVWHSEVVKDFRNKTIGSSYDGCRKCIVYQEINN